MMPFENDKLHECLHLPTIKQITVFILFDLCVRRLVLFQLIWWLLIASEWVSIAMHRTQQIPIPNLFVDSFVWIDAVIVDWVFFVFNNIIVIFVNSLKFQ